MRSSARPIPPAPGSQCPSFAEVWPVLNEPATDADLAAAARAHLATCAYCQQQLADYERLDLDIRRYLGPSGPPRYRTEEIMKDILEGASELTSETAVVPLNAGAPPAPVPAAPPPKQGGTRRVLSGLAALAAVLVIVVLAATLFAHVAPRHQIITGKSTPTLVKGSQWWLSDIAMASPEDGWAVGYAASPFDTTGGDLTRALLMHYQHGTWSSQVLSIQGWLSSISMVSTTDGWAIGQSNQVGTLLLHYDGQSWKQVAVQTHGDYMRARIQMLSATEGWAVGEDSILHYDGHTWQQQALPASLGVGTMHSVSLLGVSMLSPAEGWAVGSIFPILNAPPPDGSDAALPDSIILHYSGGQWTVQQTLHHVTLNSVAMLSAHDGWIAGRSEEQVQSGVTTHRLLLHYSGGQWVAASLPEPNDDSELHQITMLSATEGWIISGGQYLLHYNGVAWNQVALPAASTRLGYDLSAVSMLSTNEAWAAGSLVSDPDQGIPDYHGGYIPTVTPIFLHYVNGAWSIYNS